jgi:hypothetical protein
MGQITLSCDGAWRENVTQGVNALSRRRHRGTAGMPSIKKAPNLFRAFSFISIKALSFTLKS